MNSFGWQHVYEQNMGRCVRYIRSGDTHYGGRISEQHAIQLVRFESWMGRVACQTRQICGLLREGIADSCRTGSSGPISSSSKDSDGTYSPFPTTVSATFTPIYAAGTTESSSPSPSLNASLPPLSNSNTVFFVHDAGWRYEAVAKKTKPWRFGARASCEANIKQYFFGEFE